MSDIDNFLSGTSSDSQSIDDFLGVKKKPESEGIGQDLKNYALAIPSSLAKGTAKIASGVGTFQQAPVEYINDIAQGGLALADRGASRVLDMFSPTGYGHVQPNADLQQNAQAASEKAATARAAYSAVGMPGAQAGLTLEKQGRAADGYLSDFQKRNIPELVQQQANQSKAEGFIDNTKAFFQNPLASTSMAAESLPAMGAGMGIGKAMSMFAARGTVAAAETAAARVAAAGGDAAAQSSAAQAIMQAAQQKAVTAASIGGAGSEAGFAALGSRESTFQQVSNMPFEKLAEAPRFNEILTKTGDKSQAREQFASEIAAQTPLLVGLGTAAGTVLTNKIFGGDATAKALVGSERVTAGSMLKNTAQEGVEEVLQGIPEDIVTHGAMVQADKDHKLDIGGGIAQNFLAGAAMGGAGHGASYGRQIYSDAKAEPSSQSPTQNDAPTDAPSGPTAPSMPSAPVQSESEKTLLTPTNLTGLDRAGKIGEELTTAQTRLANLTPENGYGPTFDGERAELAQSVAELTQEHAEITKDWPKFQPGADTSFSTETGVKLDASYALVEADGLQTSHDTDLRTNPKYPQELQPRDRERAASAAQISGIVQKLDPARLGLSADAATGAPIVGADGLVESGNARTIALKRIYQANGQKAADYRTFLTDNATQFGISPEQVAGMQNPVLVRVRNTPVNRAEFAKSANAPTAARMSSTEQARSDAARMDSLDDLVANDSGDFSNSHDFIRRFNAQLSPTELGDMMTADGRLSPDGYKRIRNAVLAKAYGDTSTLERMTESLDDNLRNVSKALLQVAPQVAKIRQSIQEGALHDADITPDLLSAVDELSKIKDKGRSVAEHLNQAGMFGNTMTPEAKEMLQFLDENLRRPKKMAEFVLRYMDALSAAGNPNQTSMFDEHTPSKSDIIQSVKGDINEQESIAAGRNAEQNKVSTGSPDGQRTDASSVSQSNQGNEQGPSKQVAANDAAREEFKDALDDLGAIARKVSGARMMREEDYPDLLPTLVKLFTAAFKIVGHDMKNAKAYVREQLRANPALKKIANFIKADTMEKAALKALNTVEQEGSAANDMFSAPQDDKIKLLLGEDAPSKSKPIVLVYGGSFNPIHAMHVEITKQAKQLLEDAGYTVETVLISPSPQSLLAAKSGAGATSLTERTSMAKKAFSGMDGFTVTDAPSRAAAEITGKLKRTQQADFVREQYPNASIVSLTGADTAPGHPPGFPSVYSGDKGSSHEGYYYLAMPRDESDSGVSSSKVRKLVEDGEQVPVAMAHAEVVRHFKAVKGVSNEMAIDGILYDAHAENFGMAPPPLVLDKNDPMLIETHTKSDDSRVVYGGKEMSRGEMRKDIVDRHFVKHSPAPTNRNPIAYVMGGGGASGKGTIKNKLKRQGLIQAAEAVDLDPDEIKLFLPEFKQIAETGDSRGANVTHEESSDLAKQIKQRAIDGRYDLILDVTLGNPIKGEKYLRDLKAAGYDVHLYGVTVQPEVAVIRAMLRAEKTRRFVPISHLLAAHKGFNSAFAKFAEIADEAKLYENTDGTLNIAEKVDGALTTKAEYNEVVKRSQINENATKLREISQDPSGQGLRQNQRPDGRPDSQKRPDAERSAPDSGPQNSRSGQERVEPAGLRNEPVGQIGFSFVDGADFHEHASNSTSNAQSESANTPQGTDRKRTARQVRAGDSRSNQLGFSLDDNAGHENAGMEQTSATGKSGKDELGKPSQQRDSHVNAPGIPAGRDIPLKSGLNYVFTDEDLTYAGSWSKKAEQNVDAVELLQKLTEEKRQATPEEQKILAKFNGWGASEIANAIFGKKIEKLSGAIEAYHKAKAILDAGGKLTRWDNSSTYYDAQRYAPIGYGGEYSARDITPAKFGFDAQELRYNDLRARLKAALSKEAWDEAARSTQYAHYTSKAVVKSMWAAMERMGFKGGTILEPGSGVGAFPGLMPASMSGNSIYTGIEFDTVTGGILKQLFPDERILVESFVDSKLPKNFYDIAIGNPPFSQTKILSDPEYAKQALSLHDYFFAKSIDRVKPGGLVMYVTSRYTMDKQSDKARAYLASKADLVGAIRLSQTAFKQNAGTEVVTDVIFLRKKVPGEKFEHAKSWAKVEGIKTKDGAAMINEYFVANPHMVLGTHALEGSMYGPNQYTVLPIAGDIEQQFASAVDYLPANIYKAPRGSAAEAAQVREIDFNPKAQKEGSFYVSDAGVLMQRENGVGMRAEKKNAKDTELLKDFVPMRDALKQAHYDQLNNGDWESSLKALQKAYADFTKKNGKINQFVTKTVKVKLDELDEDGDPTGNKIAGEEDRRSYPLLDKLIDDPDYTLVAALENVNDDTGEITPSDFLSKRVLKIDNARSVETPIDAMLSTLNDVGHVDIPLISSRLGITQQEAIDSLGSSIYNDPESGWVTADEYLGGNVKRKLDLAREVAKGDKDYERNIAALVAVQPEPKTPGQINPSIGMNWIPGKVYAQFIYELTNGSTGATVEWNPRTKNWLTKETKGGKTLAATADWGTSRRNIIDLMDHALTGRPIRIETKDETTKVTTLDSAATEAANEKLNTLKKRFESWVWEDPTRTDALVRTFNDTFNTTVNRSFDGSHLTLPGSSALFNVFDHVKRGAWRIIQTGNTYLAHAVGSGKTFQMVISAMEQKRLGLIKKPMMVVPNHMLKQFAHEWQLLYPAARLMVADENNFHMDNRRRFVSRVAMSDLDGVIITHSAFKLMDLDPAFKKEMIEEQLGFFRAALEEAGGDVDNQGKSRDPKIKQIERQIENFEQKLEKAMSSDGKDKNVRFDELGVDFLYVDEAHEYRKLDFSTTRKVKGVNPIGSGKAFDLYMKSQYLERKTPGRSLVMASGTPITNTVAELYSLQKFMGGKELEEKGIDDFDSWAAMFGREKTDLEPNAAGKYEPVTRFSSFVNVPELTQMFREFADVLTSDTLAALLGDKRPKVKGGSRTIRITPKVAEYADFQEELVSRVERSRKWKPSKGEANNPDPIIRIIGDGRLAAIDMRFINPSAPSNPDSKLNTMISDVISNFKETADMEYSDKQGIEPNKGASMMVFSDLGFGAGVAANRGFSARAWMEKRLRDEGIPMAKVAFMSDYKKSADKLKLFKDVNAGRVRILVGSSKNMGTGVNAQQRLKTLFHLDSPWFPADLEQREGRAVRQGNKNPEVTLNAYAAKGTYDENMWKMLASKQYFISQALSGDPNLREIEDLDSQSQYDLISAMVAEDPRILQLAGINVDIEKMQRLYKAHEDTRARFRHEYVGAKINVEANTSMMPKRVEEAAKVQDISGDKFIAKSGKKSYSVRAEFGQALIDQFNDLSAKVQKEKVKIGEVSGFPIYFEGIEVANTYVPQVSMDAGGWTSLFSNNSASPVGITMTIQNSLTAIARKPAKMQKEIDDATSQMYALEARLNAPFPMAQMLADKIIERDNLEMDIEMNAVKSDEDLSLEREQALTDDWQRESGAITPMFSRGKTPVKPLTKKNVQSIVDVASRLWKNKPDIVVIDSMQDPVVPAKVREADLEQKSQGATGEPKGFFYGGKVYIVASALNGTNDAIEVLYHEALGHYGLRGLFGSALNPILAQVATARPAEMKAKSAEYGRDLSIASHRMTVAEEVLAELAQTKPDLPLVQRAIAAIRTWLRNHVSYYKNLKLTDAEIINNFILPARAFVERGNTGKSKASVGVMFSRTTTQESAVAPSQETTKTLTERTDDFINKSAATMAPIDKIIKGVTQLAKIDRATTAIYNGAAYLLDRYTPEQVKAGIVSDYGIPEAVIDRRAGLSGHMNVQTRKAGKLIDKLATLTREESRVAYEWMNNDNVQAAEHLEKELPPESVAVLKEVKDMINSLSKEAVAMGQLSQEAYDRNAMEYLRRSYVKHTLTMDKGESRQRSAAIALLGEQYKGRGLSESAPMAQIKNVAPEWWNRKTQNGKADKQLKGETFIRLERRASSGEGTTPFADMGNKPQGKLLEVAYVPTSEPIPNKYVEWDKAGTWEVRDTKGADVILWRDFTKAERENMGEIDEARFAIAKTLHAMIHDVEVGRYLEWIGKKYGLADARQVPGELVEAKELSLMSAKAYTKGQWVQVPDSKIQGTDVKKYGALAGKFIPAPIFNDIRQISGAQFRPLGEVYAKVLGMWKMSKTALSPAVHLNNVMSNFVMADWHDVSAGHIAKALRVLLSAHDRQGQGIIGSVGNVAARAGFADREVGKAILDRYQDSGGNIGTFASKEMQREQIEPLLDAIEKEMALNGDSQTATVGVMNAVQFLRHGEIAKAWEATKGSKPGKAIGTEGKNLLDVYQSEDEVFRLAAWLKAKEEGKTDMQAGHASRSSFLDYSINAPWIANMRATGFPFLAFTYRSVPMLAEMAAKKPWKLMKLGMMVGALNALGFMLSGGNEDDERKYLPDEKKGRIWGVVPKLVRMPWNDNDNQPVFLDIRRFIPSGDVFDLGQGHSAVPIPPSLMPGGPLALFAEVVVNKSMFTGQAITLGTDTASESAGKTVDYLWKALMPNIPILPGTYGFTNIMNADKGKTDTFGRELSLPQALANTVGIKVGSYSEQVMRNNAAHKMNFELSEIDLNISKLKHELSKHGITRDEFNAKAKIQTDKKKAVIAEFKGK